MKNVALITALAILILVIFLSINHLTANDTKDKNMAPNFTLPGSDGKTYTLSSYRGKQAVVLAWFPKAFTPGCTTECKLFGEEKKKLEEFDVAYFTISVDPPEKNKKFAESVHATYPILSDSSGDIARAYGVMTGDKKTADRWTFYIGRDGEIQFVDKNVKPATAVDDVVKKLDELNVARKNSK